MLVKDEKLLLKHYTDSFQFRIDVISMIPTDVLYFALGLDYPEIRINKLLRLNRMFEFFDCSQTMTNYPF